MAEVKIRKDLKNKTLSIEYVVNAPLQKVWRAYTEREWFEKWWGPEGWETTVKEFNFTPGGRIHYGMKCVDKNQGEWYGQESWGLMKVEEVNELRSFLVTDVFCSAEGIVDESMPRQKFGVELVDEGNKTRLISRSITETAQQLEELIKMGMIEGFSSQLNKLDKLVKSPDEI